MFHLALVIHVQISDWCRMPPTTLVTCYYFPCIAINYSLILYYIYIYIYLEISITFRWERFSLPLLTNIAVCLTTLDSANRNETNE